MKKVVGVGLLVGIVLLLLVAAYLLFTWRTARVALVPTPTAVLTTTAATPTLAATPTAAPPTMTPTATATATPTPVPTETAVLTGHTLPINTLDNQLGFHSYQFDFLFSFITLDENGVEQEQSSQITYQFQEEPPGKSVVATVDGLLNMTSSEIQLYELADRTFAVLPSLGCVQGMSGVAELAAPFAELVSPEALLGDLGQAERILPDEEIGGIPVAHYRLDESMLNEENSQLESAEGHLYLALEGGYVVRLTLDGQGSLALMEGVDLENGRLHLEYTLSHIDQPLEITLPDGCAAP